LIWISKVTILLLNLFRTRSKSEDFLKLMKNSSLYSIKQVSLSGSNLNRIRLVFIPEDFQVFYTNMIPKVKLLYNKMKLALSSSLAVLTLILMVLLLLEIKPETFIFLIRKVRKYLKLVTI
jgi:hypothetical protein